MQNITLKLANTDEELKFLFNARSHPLIIPKLSGHPPASFEQHLKYVHTVQGLTRWIYIAYSSTEQKIGYSQIYDVKNQQLEVGFVVTPEFQNKGYGKALVLATMREANLQFNHYHIILQVKETNTVAIHLYQQIGYVETQRIQGLIHMIYKN